MAEFKVRLEWKVEETYTIEAASEHEAYEKALDLPITNSRSLGIHLAEVIDSTGKKTEYF
jgi:hypothetical protein